MQISVAAGDHVVFNCAGKVARLNTHAAKQLQVAVIGLLHNLRTPKFRNTNRAASVIVSRSFDFKVETVVSFFVAGHKIKKRRFGCARPRLFHNLYIILGITQVV